MIKLNMELPPEVARRFVEDMDAFHAEPNPLKRDGIALRQLHTSDRGLSIAASARLAGVMFPILATLGDYRRTATHQA